MTTRRHLVLDAGPMDDLFDVVAANLADPTNTGMTFFPHDVTAPGPNLTHNIFIEENGRARVVLVVDTSTPVQYVIMEALDSADADRVTDALARNLRVISPARLREAATENLDEAPGHLVRMALGASAEADPETVDILTRGLRSLKHDTRLAAIEAASLTQWPELEKPLQKAQETESDPELKQFATTALDSLRQVLGER